MISSNKKVLNDNKEKSVLVFNEKFDTKEYIFENFSWILLLLISIIAGLINPIFFSFTNLSNLLLHSVILGILVLAESICLISGHFDLTIESNLIFTAVIAAWLISSSSVASGLQLNPFLAIIIMLIIGMAVGAVNGFLVAYVGMNPFITTLAMSIILSGFSVIISKGRTIYPLPKSFVFLGSGLIGKIPVSIIVLFILYFIFYIFLTFLPLGRKLYAVGNNSFAADASGINTKLTILIAYILSGFLCAFAGWIMSGRLNSASSIMTTDILLFAFAAAVIGGVSLNGGTGKVLGVFGGVLLLSTINNLMNLARVSPFIIQATTGGIILFAMFINTIKNKKLF
jgi:ribose/xylose/arabinose/galactoside ABC-type transport system permease subunit